MTGEEPHGLIRTDRRISKDAGEVHGITLDMLAGQPKPEEVFASFQNFIADSMPAVHIDRLEITFLRHELQRMDKEMAARHKCALKLSRKQYLELMDEILCP